MLNNKMVLVSLSLVMFMLVVSGCSVLQTQSSGGGVSYFPCNQGYTWTYSSNDGYTQITSVEGSTSIGSITVQKISSKYMSTSNSTMTSDAYYRVDGTGVYYHGSPSNYYSTGMQMFAFPLEVGKTWMETTSGANSYKIMVTAKENVTVPAGTFDCYKISMITKYGTIETSSNVWLGDNVGIVKTNSSTSTIESVLQSKNF
ncbi:MAG: hypothetical protein ABIH50_02145 [bacterium]